jgi:hypothetical protein
MRGTSPFLGDARIHMDYMNAYTGPSVTAGAMRHEAAHLLNPGMDEGAIEAIARSCSP